MSALTTSPHVLVTIRKNALESYRLEGVHTDAGPRLSIMLFRMQGGVSRPVRNLGQFHPDAIDDLVVGVRAFQRWLDGGVRS